MLTTDSDAPSQASSGANHDTLEAELESLRVRLRNTEQTLLQREKMAALGELMAGTAHEINTPLGAIQASIWNMQQSLGQSLSQLPQLYEQLSPELRQEFQQLLDWSQVATEPESSRAERKLRRQIRQALEDLGVADAETLALSISQMGIVESLQPIQKLLLSDQAQLAVETVYNIAALKSNGENIQIAAERANRIVAALRGYARQGNEQTQSLTKIGESIDVALTLYHNQIKHDIELTKDYGDVPEILCYPDELLQVWSNLIGNAIQAMGGKGAITIRLSQTESHLVATIRDSGPGIPPDIQANIFTPFFTTKPSGEGCGLGLAIVHQIIQKHGGQIEFVTQPGQTEFQVFLPLDGYSPSNPKAIR